MGAGVTCWIKEVFEKTLWEAFGGNASQEMLFRGALHLCTLSSSASTSQPCLCPCLCSRLATHHRWSLFKKWKKHTQPILKVLLALKIKAPYTQAAGAKGQAQGKVSREQKGKEVHRKGTRTSCFMLPCSFLWGNGGTAVSAKSVRAKRSGPILVTSRGQNASHGATVTDA